MCATQPVASPNYLLEWQCFGLLHTHSPGSHLTTSRSLVGRSRESLVAINENDALKNDHTKTPHTHTHTPVEHTHEEQYQLFDSGDDLGARKSRFLVAVNCELRCFFCWCCVSSSTPIYWLERFDLRCVCVCVCVCEEESVICLLFKAMMNCGVVVCFVKRWEDPLFQEWGSLWGLQVQKKVMSWGFPELWL